MLPADSKLKRENTLLSIFLPKKPLEISMGQLKGENVLNYNMVIYFFKNTCAYKEQLFFVCSRDNNYTFTK